MQEMKTHKQKLVAIIVAFHQDNERAFAVAAYMPREKRSTVAVLCRVKAVGACFLDFPVDCVLKQCTITH